jgi:hypothetical protein
VIAAVMSAVADLPAWRLIIAGCCVGALLGLLSTKAGA